jgi:NADPH-dependent 7-cyano-7-deazaguanine reductase QueF-like protein
MLPPKRYKSSFSLINLYLWQQFDFSKSIVSATSDGWVLYERSGLTEEGVGSVVIGSLIIYLVIKK